MKHFAIIVTACLMMAPAAYSQYYFQDIVSGTKTSQNFAAYKAARVKKVTATSYEKDGTETENFGIEQLVNTRDNTLTTTTRSNYSNGSTMVTLFNGSGNIAAVVDTGVNIVNRVSYRYDAALQLTGISTISFEPADTNHYTISEQRSYTRDARQQLVSAAIIKNGSDTTLVKFTPDDNGQPAIEQWFKKGVKTETWYYYYNSKGLLTDIVRYNERAKKMLPDYVFEYDDENRLQKQTIILAGTNFYRNWLYEYDEKGLKKAESIFYKNIEQEGRVVFVYE